MGDLDVNLIKEFARRPAFYDRSHFHFKDKQWNQKAWQEISHRLGFDVHLLKDRMLQLRNRYNLEKRRLENLRSENPNKPVRSPWALFQHLTFLDGHIRPRRSYKSMVSRRTFEETLNGLNNTIKPTETTYQEEDDAEEKSTEVVKYETESEEDRQIFNNDDNCDNINIPDEDDGNDNSNNFTNAINYASSSLATQTHPSASGGYITVRNIDAMKRSFQNQVDIGFNQSKKRRISSYEKYEAFGKFLTISLCDLPENKALRLVEKFTSELVKAALGVDDQNTTRETPCSEEIILPFEEPTISNTAKNGTD